jgi:transposase
MEAHLQTIIRVDKKNPHFTLIRNIKDKTILVYFGAALLEVVDDSPDNPNLKFMIARLFNAGVNQRCLKDTFGFCYSTFRRWGEALKTKDAQTIVYALSGQGAPKKLTVEIQSYVSHRFKSIYAENKYSYSKEIRKELLEVFNTVISAETLRPLFNELKEKYLKKKVRPVENHFDILPLLNFTIQLALPPAKPILALPAHVDNPSPCFSFPTIITNQEFPSSQFPRILHLTIIREAP